MSNIFLISDIHFDHENILNFTNRPYDNVGDMNEDIIEKWNRVVDKRDTVICLGDWGMSSSSYKFAHRLKGYKRLVMGNHDTGSLKHLLPYFGSVHGSLSKRGMLLTHMPVMMDKYHSYHCVVHGHIHDKSMNIEDKRYININMDVWDQTEKYAPIPIEEVSAERLRRLGVI